MIESRYKIEYVLPDEDVKKSSPFRVLWYLLLIPLVLLAVTAITYDFSLKKISEDSTVLLEKAKVAIFNLEDRKQFNTPVKTSNTLVEKVLIAKPKKVSKPEQNEVLIKSEANDKPENIVDKKLISELTAKQEEQLKAIQEQIEENKKLSKSLSSLSSKLVLEKTRNDSLNSKLSEQEKDRLELEELLNKTLADFEKSKQLTIQTNAKKQVVETISAPKIVKSATDSKDTEVVDTEDNQKTNNTPVTTTASSAEIVQIKEKKEEIELSETDKIIKAMSAEKEQKAPELITTEKTETKPRTFPPLVLTEKTTETSEEKPKKEKEITFSLGIQNNESLKTNDSLADTSKTETQKNKPDELKEDTNTDAKVEKTTIDNEVVAVKPDPTIEANQEKPVNTEPSKTPSPVDAIIAAMQQAQSNDSTESDQNIDPELEKDIKQQLVEQGDISIDN